MAGISFDWLSQLPDNFMSGQDMRSKWDTRQNFRGGLPRNPDGTVDYGAAVDLAAKSGNMDLMRQLAPMVEAQGNANYQRQKDARDFAFRQDEAKRTQANLDRQFQFQSQEKPTIQTIKDAQGNDTLVRIMPDGTAKRIDTGIDQTPTNPFAYGGKMSETQSKDALYADRMFDAEKVLSDPAVHASALDPSQHMRSMAPFGFGNYLVSNDFQKFDQAKRNFVNATLRRESGAVISKEEFDNANKQYFPVPGDSPQVTEQKRQNRIAAVRGFSAGAGPAYQPPMLLNESGALVPNPRNQRPQAAQPQQPAQQPKQQQSQFPQPKSKAEFDALDSGTKYLAPDGNIRTKP